MSRFWENSLFKFLCFFIVGYALHNRRLWILPQSPYRRLWILPQIPARRLWILPQSPDRGLWMLSRVLTGGSEYYPRVLTGGSEYYPTVLTGGSEYYPESWQGAQNTTQSPDRGSEYYPSVLTGGSEYYPSVLRNLIVSSGKFSNVSGILTRGGFSEKERRSKEIFNRFSFLGVSAIL